MLTQLTARTKSVYTETITNEKVIGFNSDGEYIIKGVDGLGAVKTNVNSLENAYDPGSEILGTRTPTRNIVITVGFNPDYSVDSDASNLRRDLYSVYTPGMTVYLELEDTVMGTMTITGVVESNEPDIFSKDPQTQISIICGDPYFRKNDVHVVYPSYGEDGIFTLDFEGNVPVGFKLTADCIYTSTLFFMQTNPITNATVMGLNLGMVDGDTVTISSVKGNRFAHISRTGVVINAIASFYGSLSETQLQPGENWFQVFQATRTTNLAIEYEVLYEGL